MRTNVFGRFSTRLGLAAAALLVLSGAGRLRAQEVLKVDETDARRAAITKIEPAYPPLARQSRAAGKAVVEVVVDAGGKVEKAQPVSGNPLLTAAAAAAVRQWKFAPFEAGGKPARASFTLSFNFVIKE
jgi:TonB family protein